MLLEGPCQIQLEIRLSFSDSLSQSFDFWSTPGFTYPAVIDFLVLEQGKNRKISTSVHVLALHKAFSTYLSIIKEVLHCVSLYLEANTKLSPSYNIQLHRIGPNHAQYPSYLSLYLFLICCCLPCRRPLPTTKMPRLVCLSFLVLTLALLVLDVASASYKKPPFNGSIFGKRAGPQVGKFGPS